jgi:mannose-6-phosphate isomerase-like protein (cupin superfamily)
MHGVCGLSMEILYMADSFAAGCGRLPSMKMSIDKPTTETEVQSTNHENKSEWLQTRPGERCLIRISAADTNGAYSVVEIVSDHGDGTPIHIHQNEDEHFIIILGGTARIASGEKIFDAAAGTAVTLSKGVPHAWCNLSNSPLRMVVISTPGDIEEILRLIAKGVILTSWPLRRNSAFGMSAQCCPPSLCPPRRYLGCGSRNE